MLTLAIYVLLIIIYACLARVVMALSISVLNWDTRNWGKATVVKSFLLAVYKILKVVTWLPYNMFRKAKKGTAHYVKEEGLTPDNLTMGFLFGGVMLTGITWFHLNPVGLIFAAVCGLALVFSAFRLGVCRASVAAGYPAKKVFSIDFRPVMGVSVLILALIIIYIMY